jgi:hypothetical protein
MAPKEKEAVLILAVDYIDDSTNRNEVPPDILFDLGWHVHKTLEFAFRLDVGTIQCHLVQIEVIGNALNEGCRGSLYGMSLSENEEG